MNGKESDNIYEPSGNVLLTRRLEGCRYVFEELLRTEGAILILGGVYIVLGYLLQIIRFGKFPDPWPIPGWAMSKLSLCLVLIVLAGGIFHMLKLVSRNGRWDADAGYLMVARGLGSILTLFTLVHFLYVFSVFKTHIPIVQPFSWDAAFMRLDQVIHLGEHPWSLIQPLVGRPLITQALDLLYSIWFYLLLGSLSWMAVSSGNQLRKQFLISFFLVWIILGTVVATLFSSAGPCFYQFLTDEPGPYLALMGYLRESGYSQTLSLLAMQNQDIVLGWYKQGGEPAFGYGISAMPSMHVATAVLMALAGLRMSRLAGWLLGAYALAVQVGSVHLGWHYAVDGYLASLATVVIWKGVARCLQSNSLDLGGLS